VWHKIKVHLYGANVGYVSVPELGVSWAGVVMCWFVRLAGGLVLAAEGASWRTKPLGPWGPGRHKPLADGANVGWLARAFFDVGLKQFDDLGDACRAQVRAAGGGVDPAQVRLSVELRERVEERGRGRVAVEGGADIIG
jgi:hypothetical protein